MGCAESDSVANVGRSGAAVDGMSNASARWRALENDGAACD